MEMLVLRSVERLLVVLAGVLAIYLGYRLFLKMPELSEGEGNIKLPGGVSVFISRVGPGVFFALFGAAVVGFSIHSPLVATETKGSRIPDNPAAYQAKTLSYMSPAASARGIPIEIARMRIRAYIQFLNSLEPMACEHLPAHARSEFMRDLRNVKLELIHGVWGDWTHWDAFFDWTMRGAKQPPPEEILEPAALFTYGLSGGDKCSG